MLARIPNSHCVAFDAFRHHGQEEGYARVFFYDDDDDDWFSPAPPALARLPPDKMVVPVFPLAVCGSTM